MFLNYIKIALRNLWGSKLYALINILGLAVGLACCLLIALFVQHEFSYDRFFSKAERIYRLSPDFAASGQGSERHPAGNVAPLGPLLASAGVDGIEQVARIGDMHALIVHDELAAWEERFRFADAEFFNMFDFSWRYGDAASALSRPDSVAISETAARKYFGESNPLGQTLLLENTWPLTVSAVFADLPQNSHLSADFITTMAMAWKLLDFDYSRNWGFTRFHTYVLLQPQANIAQVTQAIDMLVNDTLADGTGERFGISESALRFTPYALADIHLHSNRVGEFKAGGSLAFVFTFGTLAVVLLLVACINVMNLATARALKRAKEVGVRKAIGAQRGELVLQFLCDSLLCTAMALVLALVLVELLVPVWSNVINRTLVFADLAQPALLLASGLVTLATALVVGSYPAFYLSGMQPTRALWQQRGGTRGLSLRNVLVVTQFAVSVVLLVATFVVVLQMRFVRNYDLGFSKDSVLVLWGTHADGLGKQWEVLKQQLEQHPDIQRVSEGDMTPGSAAQRSLRLEGGVPEGLQLYTKQVGFGFFDTYDIALVAGRVHDANIGTDQFTPPPNVPAGEQRRGSYVLNEAAVRALGLSPQAVLGRRLEMDFSSDFSFTVPGPVIGVVEDVHLHSLHEPVHPLVYFVPTPRWGEQPSFDIASVRFSSNNNAGNNDAATLAFVQQQWKQLIPEAPFVYHFLDADYDVLYRDEERQGQLLIFVATMTMLIACLGLFGLASLAVERRTKEIGVRKVMGGSVWSIVLLLTNDVSKLVLLSNVLAWPIAYYVMNRWLENFAYRIDLTPLIFIGSGLIALCVAWVTVGGTAAKAASQKPVLALRYE